MEFTFDWWYKIIQSFLTLLMQKIKVIQPDRHLHFKTGAYSDGVVIDGMLYISGQAAVDCKTSPFIVGTVK